MMKRYPQEAEDIDGANEAEAQARARVEAELDREVARLPEAELLKLSWEERQALQ